MNKKKTGNNKFLREFNQALILDLIRLNKAISKAELAKLTGLSPTATGAITSSLMEKGYIREAGIGESSGGRRPILLELNPRSFYSLGVDLDVNCAAVVLVDITGEIIHEMLVEMPGCASPGETVGIIERELEHITGQFGISLEKLVGIGMSVPGLVNGGTGEIVLAPNLGWENVDIKSGFKKFSGVPVIVENEAMASAICENWIGMCQGVDDFVCINVKSGIGAGIFTRGKPYKGAGGSAGEVGHIVVDENGPKCGCGNYGCLETLASTSRMVEKAKRLVRQGTTSVLNNVGNVDAISIDHVIKAARGGDEEARRLIVESARYIGIAVSNIVNTLNPSKVIIGKEFVRYADLAIDCVRDIVARKALKYPVSKVEIAASAIGEKASALGAAIIPLKTLFGR
ncbi:MAG: ROK family transcriptional regulator [Firmicutes bacterium]|nr:ROK family transcriptional regulator [Bacillota bacterium]